MIGSDVEHIRQSSALFLLKLKEKRRITQVDIVGGCQGLFSQTIDRVQASVKAKLAELGVDLSQMDGLDEAFQHVIDPFEGIETCHLQERYFRDKLGLIVSIVTLLYIIRKLDVFVVLMLLCSIYLPYFPYNMLCVNTCIYLQFQEPREIKIGEPQYRPQFSGSKRRLIERYDTYQYVPLLPHLSKLLDDDTLMEQIDSCQKPIHTDGLIEDFCD